MLILRGFSPSGEDINPSPFVMKAMGYLHMLGFDWVLDHKADTRKQPAGKLPVLVDGDRVIPDSEAIATYLQQKAGRDLDDGLSEDQRRLAHATRRMIEEHLYFLVVWNRWSEDENFATIRPDLEKIAPFPLSKILPGIIRRGVLKQVAGQGIGRMSESRRLARCNADLDMLEGMLGAGPYLFGEVPRGLDLSAGAMFSILLSCPAETGIRQAMTARKPLVDYAAHAKATLFPKRADIRFL